VFGFAQIFSPVQIGSNLQQTFTVKGQRSRSQRDTTTAKIC